jgi:hypothetical protein
MKFWAEILFEIIVWSIVLAFAIVKLKGMS